jgi:hypothetical protein
LDDKALAGHFESVKARRSNKTGGETAFEEVGPMTQNDAQAEEIRRLRSGR